jgi:hypothetical protein
LAHPPDPENDYRRQVEPLLAALRQRQEVELIPPHPARDGFFRIRHGAEGMVAKRVQDGLVVDRPGRCGLVELVPEVPLPDYHVRARLRWERRLTDELQWGIYLKHRSRVTSQGPQHFFVAVYFDVPSEVAAPPRAAFSCAAPSALAYSAT